MFFSPSHKENEFTSVWAVQNIFQRKSQEQEIRASEMREEKKIDQLVKNMSSETELASQDARKEDRNNEPLDLIHRMDLRATNLSFTDETLLKAAISLKDKVVEMTWQMDSSNTSRGTCIDPTAYSGLLGTAFTCFRSYLATDHYRDLLLCNQIVDTCANSATGASRHVTFLCGRGGIYALGAVAAHYIGDHQRRDIFLNLFLEVAREKALPIGPEEGGFGMSYDLMYGRAGFLWAALFINKHLGPGTSPISSELLAPIVEAVLAGGRAGAADNTVSPLMYRWHGTRYWGAANGLAGILQVLLHFPLSVDDVKDIKATLRYMMSNRFPLSGNYPSSDGNPRDKLVQWAHGATGMAITLCKASQVFPNDREFRDAAIEAGEVVWKSGLTKKMGLADGVAGNGYAFLALYRLTGESIYEERARAFGSYLYNGESEFVATMRDTYGADIAYSLFHGLAGTVCLWFDLLAPQSSRFPGYEL